MFRLEVEKGDDVLVMTLKFTSPTVTVSYYAEAPELLNIAETGSFNGSPSNGESYFEWDKHHIKFMVGKYGDGLGGDLTVTIDNTPEIMSSLERCLENWNKVLASASSMPPGLYCHY